MKNDSILLALEPMSSAELGTLRGGIDKQAQDALWMIGYVVGIVAKVFASLFSLFK